ncbi:MAG: DUF87 domain-containing protein [Clostridiales bacterium]|nr:DUF87 domain-containing protein [Clostridiales bacterium]
MDKRHKVEDSGDIRDLRRHEVALSDDYKNAVAEKKIGRVRSMIKNSLTADRSLAECRSKIKHAEYLIGAGLFEEHDGEVFRDNTDEWTVAYMDGQMFRLLDNFSRERLELLERIVRHIYPNLNADHSAQREPKPSSGGAAVSQPLQTRGNRMNNSEITDIKTTNTPTPPYGRLQAQFIEAGRLVDDMVLKNYITRLSEMEILPLDENLKDISQIRLFRVTELVYQRDEYATYKFASVFNAVQSLNCAVFLVADSDGEKTEFYMGVRALDERRTTVSLKRTLESALKGQFPGVKTRDLMDEDAEELLGRAKGRAVAAVSCAANNKDGEFTDNSRFLQGLEKLALAMQGRKYTAVVLAQGASPAQLAEARGNYERIYTNLSPFADAQVSYGSSKALSVSDSLAKGITTGRSHTASESDTEGTSVSSGAAVSETSSRETAASKFGRLALMGAGGIAALALAPMTGGLSVAAAATMGLAAGLNPFQETITKGTQTNETKGFNTSRQSGVSDTKSEGRSDTETHGQSVTDSRTDNMQLTMKNKTLLNTLDRIDLQLKRLKECESTGMWHCAAYFLSDSHETAEMAAGTYKALMKGENSGVETSAVNFWGERDKVAALNDYVTNFLHPVFLYEQGGHIAPVTAAALVSGNELAIHMGLPRRSVCGLPVVERADFGKEVVRLDGGGTGAGLVLGSVLNMGGERGTAVMLERDSLTAHTFITGSTGSGKSNTIIEILRQLRIAGIPFLVIEPAKGEYKDIFGQYGSVTVFGTNPKKTRLLKLNPFRFPEDVHVLEHLDRLVELFNVCWPMYAAMPVILKDAMERAYVAAGWDLDTGENVRGPEVFPVFKDVLERIEDVISESKYSPDSKGDYSGALCTRVRSLTTGINRRIFCVDGDSDEELFDKSAIVDLSRVGSTETKALIMGLLVMRLQEYRMSRAKNSRLRHVTVLEEAHNLLKRTSTEQSQESANLLGKSVELLTNAIAEMRAYGEGFIIADQSPGLLDMSVIRNTNTKILLRLPDYGDRELAGRAAGLNPEQVTELAKLERGAAAVYQNDWAEPVLVKVNKCHIDVKPYEWRGESEDMSERGSRRAVVYMLIQGRVNERLDVDAERVERAIARLNISTVNRMLLGGLLAEYKAAGKLEIWRDERFAELSRIVTDTLDCRAAVEREASLQTSNAALRARLAGMIQTAAGGVSDSVSIAAAQCLMRDFGAARGERDIREREARADMYCAWAEDIKAERGAYDVWIH